MKHITVFKDKSLYSSFPLFDYISDNEIVIGFFTAPKPDHCGIYDWKTMISADQGETWQETKDKKYKFNDNYMPRFVSDSFKSNIFNLRVGSYGFIFSENKLKISDSIAILKDEEYSKIPIPGIKHFFSFPRFYHHEHMIMIPMYAILKNNKEVPFIYISYDNGENWELYRMFPDNIEGNEYALIRLTSGRIMAIIRSDNYPLLQSYSWDGGRSWTYPICTNMIGNPPHLLRLQNGKILCSYGYRNQLNTNTVTIHTQCSNDEGESWKWKNTLRVSSINPSNLHKKKFRKKYKPNGIFDFGYPVSIQLSTGEILTAYYITSEDGITHIETTKWSL